LIEHALEGNHEGLKERTLGIDVFGRDANYDNSADPVVRTTANEIRKRLALYYEDPASHNSVRIRLVPGSYFPSFEFEGHNGAPQEAQRSLTAALRRNWKSWIAVVLVAVAAVVGMSRADFLHSTGYLIWKPLLDSKGNLVICLSDYGSAINTKASANVLSGPAAKDVSVRQDHSINDQSRSSSSILFVDAIVGYNISNRLFEFGRTAQPLRYSEVTLNNFRSGPVVLVGGSQDPWSPIFVSGLRYSVHFDPITYDRWIQDSQSPTNRAWKISGREEQTDIDYAVITRFLDPRTGEWIMALTGLTSAGTEAAGYLISSHAMAKTLPATLRTKKNFQVVLKVAVVNGIVASPQILAIHTW
jgi:hypothetical protein